MRHLIILLVLFAAFVSDAFPQLTIEECLEKARNNYPLIRKYSLIEQAKHYSLSNAQKAYLPQLQVSAKASYQSSAVEIPIEIPGLDIPALHKDQYMAVAEANQLLWDGGGIRSQKRIIEARSEVEKKQVEVELYAIKEQVNQLFFGILLFNAKLEQNRVLTGELERNHVKVAGYMENGIANAADLDAVKVEQLNVKQARIQLLATRAAYVDMLALMTGETLDGVSFVKPAVVLPDVPLLNSRPELQLFDAQNNLFDSQKNLIRSGYMPRLGLFVQGGVGRPALNMLSNAFEPFYIGGVRLTWNFGSLYTQQNDLRKIEVDKHLVNTQRELFLYHIRLTESRENKDIKRIRDLMKDDDGIITLRENIRRAAEAKVSNGMMTVTDLLQEISREDAARHTKAAHEIELLMAIYQLKNTLGIENYNNDYE
ncbi:MAG: TolC family protein [Dysgonamonadaceae bacterium]|jgi:outer membrane protein TolC|nr:TolC family protein [Dysgonamonadaceae bacterium]